MAETRTTPTPQFVFGVFIMAAGVILMLDTMQVVDAGRVFAFWPAGLILLGGTILARDDTPGRFWGFVWIIVGSWWLLRNVGLIRVGFWQVFWPLMLTAFGFSMVMRTLREGGHLRRMSTSASHLFAVFTETKRNLDGLPFEGATMTAVFGSCDLDLRRATIPSGEERVIEIFGVFCGHTIRVPNEWTVLLNTSPVMAETKDQRVPPLNPPPLAGPPPRLIVRGAVVLSEVKVMA